MDKFLDIYIFLRLNQEEVEFLKRLIMSFEIKLIRNSLLFEKSLGFQIDLELNLIRYIKNS